MRFSLALVLLLAGCAAQTGDDPADETTTTVADSSTITAQPVSTTLGMTLPQGLAGDVFDAIVADASVRAGVPESQVETVSIDERTFNDAALGCPEPGKMYAQVITPGYIVLVDAAGEVLDYRVAQDSDVFRLCE